MPKSKVIFRRLEDGTLVAVDKDTGEILGKVDTIGDILDPHDTPP